MLCGVVWRGVVSECVGVCVAIFSVMLNLNSSSQETTHHSGWLIREGVCGWCEQLHIF